MARGKATITLDRAKVARAAALIGGGTMSGVIDLALDRVIRAEELRGRLARRGCCSGLPLGLAREPLTGDDPRRREP